MSLSRTISFMDASASVAAGVLLQAVLFPAVGLQTTLTQTLKPAIVFAALSLARSFSVRRVFAYPALTGPPGGGSFPDRIGPVTDRPVTCTCSHESDRGARRGP